LPFHLFTGDREAAAADMAAGCDAFEAENVAAGATRGVIKRTVSNNCKNSRTCDLLIRKVGSRRIAGSCVLRAGRDAGLRSERATFNGKFHAEHAAFAAFPTKSHLVWSLFKTGAEFGPACANIF
jgi:hypothetical protein